MGEGARVFGTILRRGLHERIALVRAFLLFYGSQSALMELLALKPK